MEEKELIEKVTKSIKNRPDMKNINDDFLNDSVTDSLNDVKAFINHHTEGLLDEGLMTPIKDLCVIRINLTGTEGISSSSKAGTSESYISDIPSHIKNKLRKFRSLPL